jgi:hypothetical protein
MARHNEWGGLQHDAIRFFAPSEEKKQFFWAEKEQNCCFSFPTETKNSFCETVAVSSFELQ